LILVSNESEDSSFGLCGWVLIICSYILVVITYPITVWFSMNVCEDDGLLKWKIKREFFLKQVVQEYERAVIFRLGRILPGLGFQIDRWCLRMFDSRWCERSWPIFCRTMRRFYCQSWFTYNNIQCSTSRSTLFTHSISYFPLIFFIDFNTWFSYCFSWCCDL
jgi:hypothetical protein